MKLLNITKSYNNINNIVIALKNINLEIENKGIIMIFGPSGCGKSTLLNIISGIDNDYDGQVINNGNLEYITQEAHFFEEMTIYQNCSIVNSNNEIIEKYLKLFNLSDIRNKKIKKCSIGQRKRVQFIRALLSKPSILLCDEPTVSLDYENSKILMGILKELSNEIIIIMVTHDIALSKKYADRIITMGKATIIKDEIINEKEYLNLEKSHENKTIINHLNLLRFKLVSRWLESICIILLSFMMVFSMTAGIQLNKNVNNHVSSNKIWKNSLNLVKVKFLDKNIFQENEFKTPYYLEYDLFYESEIHKIVEENPEIIAVNFGYVEVDKIKNSFTQGKYFTEDWQKNVYTEEYYDSYYYQPFTYSSQPSGPELLVSQSLKHGEVNYQAQMIQNGERDSCQYSENMGSEEACLSYFYDVAAYYDANFDGANSYNRYLSVYEIVNESSFPIILGQLPLEDNEVLLAKNTAEIITKKYGFDSIEDLLNQDIEIAIANSGAKLAGAPYEFLEFKTIKVAGITSYESDYQNQVFFKRGKKKSVLYEDKLENKDVDLYYTSLEFLIDPTCDFVNVVNKLNKKSIYENSEYVLYNDTKLMEVDYLYRDASIFMTYSIVLISMCIIIFMSYYVFTKSRRQKEKSLIKNYKFNTGIDSIFYSLIIVFISLLGYLIIGEILFDIINKLVKIFKFNNILNFSLIQCCLLHLIAGILLVLMETLIGRN